MFFAVAVSSLVSLAMYPSYCHGTTSRLTGYACHIYTILYWTIHILVYFIRTNSSYIAYTRIFISINILTHTHIYTAI